MNLKDAFPRPTENEVEAALRAVAERAPARLHRWAPLGWKIAAMIAGLGAAYAAGFAGGRHVTEGPKGESAVIVKAGDMTIRPPVLIAGPRS